MSDCGFLANARLPHGGIDERMRRSAAAKEGARVRSSLKAKRDGKWGPEGPMRGSAPVDGVTCIKDIVDRLKGRST